MGQRVNKIYRSAAAVLVMCLFCGGCGADQFPSPDVRYTVTDVVDGDTIKLSGGQKIRYTGINTPETMERIGGEWVYSPQEFGPEAKEYNRAMVLGKKVRLETDVVERDKYGRYLMYVYVDDLMVNAALVEKGYAMVYTFPPNVKYLYRLIRAQRSAQEKGAGLWGLGKRIPAERASDSIGEYATVRGKVNGVGVSPAGITLYMGTDGPGSFSGFIYGRNAVIFSEMGIDPVEDYDGREIELFGEIRERGGRATMVVDNPSQISVEVAEDIPPDI